MLELWGIWSTRSLASLPGLLWPGVVAPYRVLFMGQIGINCGFLSLLFFAFKLRIYAKLNCLNRTVLTLKLRTYAKLNCSK